MSNKNSEITHKIHKHIGSLSVNKNGWIKEVNIVSWNQGKPRLDIRDWDPEHNKMSRGIGLNGEEVLNLSALLRNVNIEQMQI